METLKLLVDLLVEMQKGELHDSAKIIGIRLQEEIYKLSTKDTNNEIQSVQLQ